MHAGGKLRTILGYDFGQRGPGDLYCADHSAVDIGGGYGCVDQRSYEDGQQFPDYDYAAISNCGYADHSPARFVGDWS